MALLHPTAPPVEGGRLFLLQVRGPTQKAARYPLGSKHPSAMGTEVPHKY